ncbi:uncharacterized protein [Periplaneta americana]|uniref:uncharacterized protein n=1 Tax=Periplaneta americana TaxID=6978 RepID=UPI0037E9A5B6
MVVSRTANLQQSSTVSIKQAASARPVSQLPALGLAASSSTAAEAGPLRVTVHYHHHPAVNRATSSGLHRYTRSYSDNAAVAAAAGRGIRRVRFELPPKPPPPVTLNSGAASGRSGQHRPSAGVESWLRSRATSSLFSPSHEHQLKHGATEGRTLPSRVVIATTAVSATPRIHDTEGYRRGTLPPTSPGAACPGPNCSPEAAALLKAARDGDEKALNDILRAGVREEDLNCQDASGKTPVSYIVSSGSLPMLKAITQLPDVDLNKPDNEGNSPLHFAAQAGHVEVTNYMLSKCTGVEVDARNALGFTPLMKAALQGRTKCAKLLLFAGASPTMRDTGRGLRAEQWARFCGRYVCAEVIEKFARHRLLERTTAYGRWGSEPELGTRLLMGAGKLPITSGQSSSQSVGFKSRLQRAFRTNSSGSESPPHRYSLVSQLTTAALCASSPVLPTPKVRSLMRPLTVPKLQVTPAAAGEASSPCDQFASGLKHKKKK